MRRLICILLAVAACGLGIAQTASSTDFVIRNARVFDGVRSLPATDVWVENGKIKAVGKALNVPADVRVVDASGDTLLPGLIDAHTHTYGDALKEALIFGVTTELDMFTDPAYVRQVKQAEAQGKDLDLADLRSAGTLVTVPGGHGTEYIANVPTITAPGEAQAFVDARIAEGSDYIKVIYDDASAYGAHRPTLDKATPKAVIDAAHKRGKMAVVHIGTQQEAVDAIDAGADGLAHLFADSEPSSSFAALAAKHHVFIVPTLSVLNSVSGSSDGPALAADPALEPYLSLEDTANLKRAFPKFKTALNEQFAEHAVAELIKVKVPVLAGTDAPNPGTTHGASLHRELELLVRSGMTPQQALAAATSVPAAVFHLDDRGTIAPGKRADLVLVKGDPIARITATRDIVSVWKLGVEDNRQAYSAELAQARQAAEKLKQSPAPAGAASGGISDFETGEATASFGEGWSISTDNIMGGKSAAGMKIIDGGASGTAKAMEVSGTIDAGLPFAWAGVMFAPGAQKFAPANLAGKQGVSFWAKGDGKDYRIMLFTESGGRVPAQQAFTAGAEWKQYTFPFSAFNGSDGRDVAATFAADGRC
ncbi:MAG: CIA30 family protein [Acidobacteriales bacterium]|nr:CIA30 family protein [Terriglobales bacterium]